MIVDIVMPKMGESITEGTILEWRKEIGDIVELDEILLEIGTDKVDSEIPSSVSGTLVEILAKPNDVIDVGKVIARINSDKKNTGLKENQKDDLVNEKQVSEKKNAEDNKKKRSFTNAQPLKVVEEPVLNNAGEIQKKRFYTPIVMKIAMEKEIQELKKIDIKWVDFNFFLIQNSATSNKVYLIASVLLGLMVGISYILISNLFLSKKNFVNK